MAGGVTGEDWRYMAGGGREQVGLWAAWPGEGEETQAAPICMIL